MYYVFGAREEGGSLRYYMDKDNQSIFKFSTVEDANEALIKLYAINPDYELFKLIPNSAALCEC